MIGGNTGVRVGIYTLGCKVNQYESEAIAELFAADGFTVTNPGAPCDIYVINTCTVTAESDRKARQFIRRACAKNPNAYILVTGCLAQSNPQSVEAISGVDYICGNANKTSVVEVAKKLLCQGKREAPLVDIPSLEDSAFEKMNINRFDRTRAYVKIEDGCENKCTYCAIPAARGPVRSKSPDEVLCEVRRLTENNCKEVVLTGIETASYGKDLDGVDLASLLLEIDKIEGIGRVRLGSLDPSVMREAFVSKLAKVRSLAPHFHLSMQSGSNRVLAAMKRKYNTDIAWRNIETLRKYIPNVMLTTDIIVGFPGETDSDFEDTLEFVRRVGFLEMHVFSYSKRAGTEAATMQNQVPEQVKHARSATLIAEAEEMHRRIVEKIAADKPTLNVLFETYENGIAYGHTANFLEVAAESPIPLHAETKNVQIEGVREGKCFGKLI